MAYDYGPDGQLKAILDRVDPAKSRFISYDALNRLVQVSKGVPPASGGVPVPVEDYAYDEEGNRTSSHLSATYSSNDHNQLLEDAKYTYGYDVKGNRISRTAKVETYTYDSQNRLVGYTDGTTVASYAYDAMERRIAKTVDGKKTGYVYDVSMDEPLAHDDIVMEFSGQILKRRWMHSNAVGEPIGFEEYVNTSGVGSGNERAIYADRQGSVVWVTDPVSGSVVAAYEYDGYGQIKQTVGTLKQPYGYTGREYDAESGLYYYRARYYNSETGVFLQSDPIEFAGGALSLYGYVDQSPLVYSDPSGLTATADWGANARLTAAGTGANFWGMGVGVANSVARLLHGLRNVTSLLKAYDASPGFPDGKEPDHCSDKKSGMAKAKRQIRKMYKPLESMKRGCGDLSWDTASDVMERMIRARRGYKLVALRKLELALCHDGGDYRHRDVVQNRLDAARACMTRTP